jgi:hypothetical protein
LIETPVGAEKRGGTTAEFSGGDHRSVQQLNDL